jgi:predicted ATPase
VAGVTIGLLGGFSASAGGKAVPDGAWRLRKGRELVKLLALARGHRLHREQAMDALWPDLDSAAAANNLNQAVHVARKALGPEAIEARDGLLVLVADVDVERFEEAATAALRAGSAQAARAALALYGGELLPENRYDDFAAAPREELEALAGELSRVLDGDAGRLRLPADASSFVGRRHELAELNALLGHGRLLTLTGTGGAGKTRLALELARSVEGSFADGAAFVELAPVAVPSRVVGAVAAAFDLQPLPGQALEEALAGLVATRELLLVLDNCEHVLEASATLAGALLRAAPRLTLLVTSREPLRLPGEMVFRVPSLGIPDPEQLTAAAQLEGYESVTLFVERAAAVAPGFTLDDGNAADVARICFRLDGLPLALELAAGRVGALSPAAIAARLDDRFRLLRAGASHAPTRQQTLEATLRWSHDLLEPDERVLFRRLGVFAGGFELGAAEAVCTGDLLGLPEVADVLARLVEKSLVSVEDRGPDRRYRLLETVRLYAREQLGEAGEARALAAAHAYWALALAEAVGDTPVLDREAANMRAALDTFSSLDPQAALRLCTALMSFWVRRIDLEEAQRRFAEALEAAPEPTLARADALLAASAVGFRAGTMPAGLERAERSLEVALAVGDPRAEWRALQRLADFGSAWDDGETAMRYLERALALARRERFSGAEALGVYTLGAGHWLLGEPDQAEACLGESLELFRALAGSPERILSPLNIADVRFAGFQGVIGPRLVFEETLQPFMEMSTDLAPGYVLANHSAIARMRGDLGRARVLIDESERVFAMLEETRGLAAALVRRAYLELDEGALDEACDALRRAIELRRSVNDRRGVGIALAGLGFIEAVAGDVDRAESDLGDARDLFRRAGDRWGLASTLWRTADLEILRGRFDEAETALLEAASVLGATRRPRWLAHTIFNRAEVALARGDLTVAGMRYDEARELYVASNDHGGVAAVDERRAAVLPA